MEEINTPLNIEESYNRIAESIIKTPLLQSPELNEILGGHKIYFKIESFQHKGSYKTRGILNNLLFLRQQNNIPKQIVTYSSGNHAYSLAWACNLFNIKSKIFMPENVSRLKYNQTVFLGAEVILTAHRELAELYAYQEALKDEVLLITPSGGNLTIAGGGTVAFEALKEQNFDAIFIPCGGGGLASGTYLAKELISPQTLVFGAEPVTGNDIVLSLKQNSIFRFTDSPITIADGARTLGITSKIFDLIKNLDGIFEISEKAIIYWCCWLMHLLKVVCEPTSALGMAAAFQWLSTQSTPKEILVIITGGNIDPLTYQALWEKNYLFSPPSFNQL
jgi:threonine dehydratase